MEKENFGKNDFGKDKKWNEYSGEEKSNILNFWFYYYGGVLVTLEEIEKFRQLAMTRQDEIFNYIVTSFLFHNTIQTNVLVAAMRQDKTEELFKCLLDEKQLDDELRIRVEATKDCLIKEIVHSYLFPEPPVPMNIQIMVQDDDDPKMGF